MRISDFAKLAREVFTDDYFREVEKLTKRVNRRVARLLKKLEK